MSLYTWGTGKDLALGTSSPVSIWEPCSRAFADCSELAGASITSIAAGESHTLVATSSGSTTVSNSIIFIYIFDII